MKYLTVKLDEDVDLEAFKAGAEKVEEAAPEEVAASEPISETSEEKVEAPKELDLPPAAEKVVE